MWSPNLLRLLSLSSLALTHSIAAFTPASTAGTDALAANAQCNLDSAISPSQKCGKDGPAMRKEWTALCSEEKKQYIDAVLCMTRLPSISGDLAPGAITRYDDFVATHINQTLHIHGTGNFLHWHRYFTWTWEKALREECGYPGYQPYINWGRYALDLRNAPIFDGSDLSIGGDGAFVNRSAINVPSDATPFIRIPAGKGGGCITTGPFRNMSVNLGPAAPVLKNITANPQMNGLGYNPRCLKRDISQYAAKNWVQDQNVTDLITQSPNISAFQTTMQGNFPAGFLGVHTGGHFFVGGDPGGDLFASPGDPYFWLQHSQVDRIWWIWQNQDPANRYHVIGDTITVNNSPPSRNATLEDIIDLGVNAPESIKLADLVDTQAGPFCYSYQ